MVARKKVASVFRYLLSALLALLLLLWILMRFFLVAGMGQEKVNAYFSGLPYAPESRFYKTLGHSMHYRELSGGKEATLLFIHGSPGSWDAFVTFFADSQLVKKARIVSVDRIGYGQSDPGQPESSLYLQAALLKPLLDSLQDQRPLIVIGHSYGGPVAARLVMDYPGQVDGLLLLAALTDPALESRPVIQKWLLSPWLNWLLSRDLDVSNREILPLKGELQSMEPRWKDITAETFIIQGGKDILVEPENADYAEKMLVNAPVTTLRIPEANHFIPWTRPELIRDCLLEMMECLD